MANTTGRYRWIIWVLSVTAPPVSGGGPSEDSLGYCNEVDYAACGEIADVRSLQCCAAYGGVDGQTLQLRPGLYLLDARGPNAGRLVLPAGTKLQGAAGDPHAADACMRNPTATIDVSGLRATPFQTAGVNLGPAGGIEYVRVIGGFDGTSDSSAVTCVMMAPDADLLGVTTERCFVGVLINSGHAESVVGGTIRDGCFKGGFEPVAAAAGWPGPAVDHKSVRLDVYDSRILGGYSSLLSWIGGEGKFNRVDVYLAGTTIQDSTTYCARVTGGQDVNCCTSGNTGGGQHGEARLVLGPGNTFRNCGVAAINVEGGARGGSELPGFRPDDASHNVATLQLNCETEFDQPDGVPEIRLSGNENYSTESWPDAPVGTGNHAALVGAWQPGLILDLMDCRNEAADCGSRATVELVLDESICQRAITIPDHQR